MKNYKLIHPFTAVSLYDYRETWPQGFECVFEQLLMDICNKTHTGNFEKMNDVYDSSLNSNETLEFLQKIDWIEEIPAKKVRDKDKDEFLTVGNVVASSSTTFCCSEEISYIYALVYNEGKECKFNLISIDNGNRYFEDNTLGRFSNIAELNRMAEGLSIFKKIR